MGVSANPGVRLRGRRGSRGRLPGSARLRLSSAPDPGLVARQLQGEAASQLVSWAHVDAVSQVLVPPSLAMYPVKL